MQKKELIYLFDSILKPAGFSRKGGTWRMENEELVKIVNLQKSAFGNLYYINYGFDLKELNYEGTSMHIFRGLDTKDNNGNQLMDFEIAGTLENQKEQISLLLHALLREQLLEVNTVDDLKTNLHNRKHLNDIPLIVKEFLGITAS